MFLTVPQSWRSHDSDGNVLYCAYHDVPSIVPEGLDCAQTVVFRKKSDSLLPENHGSSYGDWKGESMVGRNNF